jgi:formate hydrogenlyase transcriptional activator
MQWNLTAKYRGNRAALFGPSQSALPRSTCNQRLVTMDASGFSERQQTELLKAATALSGTPPLTDILLILHDALGVLPGARLVGLGVHDARREVVVILTTVGREPAGGLDPGPLAREGEEFHRSQTEATTFLNGNDLYLSDEHGAGRETAVGRRLLRHGVQWYACLPLRADSSLIGLLYAGFDSPPQPVDDVIRFLKALADIAMPTFINARTRERLAKGDKRRANLNELSHVINTSLRLDAVLTDARKAIRSIEGHVVSAIGLKQEHVDQLELYWDTSQGRHEVESRLTDRMPIKGSAFARVFSGEQTYESGDLQKGRPFAHDRTLAQLGVRRYTLAPMFTRGKVIGGFLFGTDDPHPALTTDIWMYENIAMQLALAIDNARQFEELQRLSDQLAEQNIYLREEIDTEHNVEGMIGRSPAIRRVLKQIVQVAPTDSAVLILGETGVGKELVARAVHARSRHARHPLVKVNCAAIPENLVESELFGHEKGAFTSAVSCRIGRFELARNGTLFLDEVGELPLAIQAKLLRVLQDGEFERIGGTETLETNARIIAATNRDVRDEVERGTFRTDLYYRLNVFPIHVQPLADRRDDIPLLAESFIAQFNRRMGKQVKSLHADSLAYLCERDWPGNIRELRHVIERAMILCQGDELVIEPAEGRRLMDPFAARSGIQPPAAPATLATLEAVEREHIEQALRACDGLVEGPRGASTVLGLKPSTLRSRMKRLGIKRR